MKIYKLAKEITPIIKFKKLTLSSVDVCPHCQKEITEKSTWCDKDCFVFHRPCKDKGPIEHIKAAGLEEIFGKFNSSEAKEESCALDGRGRSDKMGVTEDDVDPEQLKRGIEVEHEHTDDDEIAKKIALDHLSEEGGEYYYTYLEAMEEKMKSDSKRQKE